ncbi:MAG: SdpI family protein [Oscillospiraceae bacterium]|nr:SdpI family protein [Oscillospiraceae bacterium]
MLGFLIFMILVDLIIPFTMIGFGRVFMKNPPEKINMTYGYRTAMSMKSVETWEFAHAYCGKLWIRLGLALLASVLPLFFCFGRDIDTIALVGLVICGVQLVVMMCSIIPIERALKRSFDEAGRRKKER